MSSPARPSVFTFNVGYLTSVSAILQIIQMVLGAVCIGIVGYYIRQVHIFSIWSDGEIFFLLMSTTFLIGTYCIFITSLLTISTHEILSKTLYQVVYHFTGFILLLAASLTLLIENENFRFINYDAYLSAAIIGLINTLLYLSSAIFGIYLYKYD